MIGGKKIKPNTLQRFFGWRKSVSDYFERMDIKEPPITPKAMKEAERMVEILAVLVVLLFVVMVVASVLVLK